MEQVRDCVPLATVDPDAKACALQCSVQVCTPLHPPSLSRAFAIFSLCGGVCAARLWPAPSLAHITPGTRTPRPTLATGIFLSSSVPDGLESVADLLVSIQSLDLVAALGVPVLVLANKTDLPEALSAHEVATRLNLDPASVLAVSATTGAGLSEMMGRVKVGSVQRGEASLSGSEDPYHRHTVSHTYSVTHARTHTYTQTHRHTSSSSGTVSERALQTRAPRGGLVFHAHISSRWIVTATAHCSVHPAVPG